MNLEQLLESSNPYKSVQARANRLSGKWSKTGLLEGLDTDVEKNNMSINCFIVFMFSVFSVSYFQLY